jgi:mRNA-degrading endonuclease toxin of MazEF toxin-antitoxin module
VPNLKQGQIILVEMPDPQGRNVKARPAVIVSDTSEITSEATIWCVAVTSAIPPKKPKDCVLLPIHPNGHLRTGLKKRSAAICSWLFEISTERIQKILGLVPTKQLEEVLECIESLE